ncbi:hypothetical protein GL218_05385 [Daldinia childiae]|uniref:uncharacterized protein n=1 Tax=Daldinia childiae TaxID=326645 RepID=UPI001446AD0F|nr:uncharacterized protein GL218_05385 [Daldinia childiae]KAF3058264.1 hypothetical protein GL218_05385 [Daldinia childiae]
MISRFGNHKITYQEQRDELSLAEYLELIKEANDAPTTGTMVQDGKRQYFTVCPKTDLFCLQPFVECGHWEEFEKNMPIFNKLGSPEPHIALEFDPMWINPQTDEQWSMYNLAFEATTGALGRWASKLWFIDYRIRPNLDMSQSQLTDAALKINIQEDDRVGDIAQRLGNFYDLQDVLSFEGIPNTDPGISFIQRNTTPIVLTLENGDDKYRVNIADQTQPADASGISFNVALNGAFQANTGAGPGHSIRHNEAKDEGTRQVNSSMCIIM